MTNKSKQSQFSLHDQFFIGVVAGLVASGERDAASIFSQAKKLTDSINPIGAIDWSKAPEWANFYAVDADQNAGWFDVKPEFHNDKWFAGKGTKHAQAAPTFAQFLDAENSLQKRGE